MSARALVIVDMQNEYVAGPLAIGFPPPEDAIGNAVRAIAAARTHGVPVLAVQHSEAANAPVFARGGERWQLHPRIAAALADGDRRVEKSGDSVLDGTGLLDALGADGVRTVALAGFMTNNCILATAIDAAAHGLAVEVLSDATGAIPLANRAGAVGAEELHRALMVLLQSNWAAVATTDEWIDALARGARLEPEGLIASAALGRGKR